MWRAHCPPDELAVCEMTNSISCNPALPARKLNAFIRTTIKRLCPMKPSIYWLFVFVPITLGLGIAFFLGGIRHSDQKYNPAAARIYSSMMLLAAASLAVPSAFSRYFGRKSCSTSESPACCC